MAISTKTEVKVPNRSGFDKSHQNLFTTKVGTLTPLLVDEVVPNTTVDLEAAISASLPPLASDTFMRCDLKAEAFFVPHRLCYGGYEAWLTGDKIYDPDTEQYTSASAPVFYFMAGGTSSAESMSRYEFYKPGSLADYLGFRAPYYSGVTQNNCYVNPYPFLAYHRIYDDWYRNTKIQKPLFNRPTNTSMESGNGVAFYNLPFCTLDVNDTARYNLIGSEFPDGVGLGSLRQRNFGIDYFTNATPNPQDGAAQSVRFSTTGSTGNFTIASLRAANSLQQFAERNNLAGNRLQDYVSAHYGANLSSGVAQRSIYLGSASYTVYSKGVNQTAEVTTPTNNPFNSVAAEYGKASAAGTGKLIDHFTAEEPGIIMVLVSLVPKVTYASGIDRMLMRYRPDASGVPSPTDMADPLLQNVGNQPIFRWELAGENAIGTSADFSAVFGYTERYADWKTKHDSVHGLLRDGESLQSFALQRSISGITSVSSEFLEIPTNYLDQVAAVNGDISKYGVWIDSFLNYKVSMPLAEYSIPSLQDPAYEHGHSVDIDLRGSRL